MSQDSPQSVLVVTPVVTIQEYIANVPCEKPVLYNVNPLRFVQTAVNGPSPVNIMAVQMHLGSSACYDVDAGPGRLGDARRWERLVGV